MTPRPLEPAEKLPLVILAGSDRRPGPVPRGAEQLRFVMGYKGASIQFEGRPLIQLLLERIRASDAFGAVYLAGPKRIYDKLVNCEIVDTDSHLGRNIHEAVGAVRKDHGHDTRVAFISCDILPTSEELASLVREMVLPAPHSPTLENPALTLSVVICPRDLGASSWKPKYRIRLEPGQEPVSFLPGHLGIAWPSRLRMGLFYRVLQLAYSVRNRDLEQRRRAFLARITLTLLLRDLWNLFRLYPPTLTYSVLRHGLGTFVKWRRNETDLAGLAHGLGGIVVRRKYFRRQRGRAVRIVVTPYLSLAKDIDTEEERVEMLGQTDGPNSSR